APRGRTRPRALARHTSPRAAPREATRAAPLLPRQTLRSRACTLRNPRVPLSDGSCHHGAALTRFRAFATRASSTPDRLIPVQIAPHPSQKPLVTPVVIFDCFGEFLVGQ